MPLQAHYVLGHTSVEQQRLIRQARVLAPLTERFLRDAGISPGMRVLDIGCGMGDVTMIAAQCVGTAGHVTSIDLDQASIETAQRRAAAFGFENTSFHRAGIAEYLPSNPFDAIIGRLVLQFIPDPIAIIKRLYGMLRPGGILALQEPTWKLWLTYSAHLPLRLSVTKVAHDAFQAGGASTEMEQQLYQGFIACGLHAPQLRVELPLGNSPEIRSLLPDLLAALMPNIIAKGLTIGHLGDLNTLKDRLDQELDTENSFASYVALIGAFAHK
ncbi:class I SAM-dependent methyltransferase [Bradyrhizobium sp. Tv2a-2]|uniref:class I SAM-dependent methyltransferase n=1 Tax=Bradyrhizobium sp. Tv2a-2 TaxID=113395 RepID=UPI000A064732|nr:class I SAM-dependent methyltransferase [Bradyrhizobium sp. Tv2a-2]